MYLYDVKRERLPDTVGNKARNLRRLHDKGFCVPDALVCSWEAHERFHQGDEKVLDELRLELQTRLDGGGSHAVRSSANVEDSFEHSFAGQFKSFLNVQGLDGILAAMREAWAAADSPAVQSYLAHLPGSTAAPRMAVLVQRMVNPRASGVAFSRNPMTGADETVIEAVPGSGEALVQAGATPQRWVNRRGQWLLKPESDLLPESLAEELAAQTRRISRAFRADVDLEWVYDGQNIQWLQLRDITSLRDLKVYSNRISKEMLPGIIKPLVWSVNVPLVCGAWTRLLAEATGERLDPLSLAGCFYYRAYWEMGAFGRIFERLGMPRDSLERMMGLDARAGMSTFKPGMRMLPLVPRLVGFLAGKMRFAAVLDRSLPALEQRYRQWPLSETSRLPERELLSQVDALFALSQEAAYLNIVAQLLMFSYNAMLRRQLQKLGVDCEHFDLAADIQGLELYDPAPHLRQLHEQFAALPDEARQAILAGDEAALPRWPQAAAFHSNVAAFLERFGHVSDSGNDFSSVPWRETPHTILQLIAGYRPPQMSKARLELATLPLSGMRRRALQWAYNRARHFRLYREQANLVYTYGYGLMRVYFLALGDCLVQRGVLERPQDVFYLHEHELRDIVGGQRDGRDAAGLVAQRQAEIEQCRDAALPTTIYGDQAPPLVSARSRRLRGTPTSRGYYTGKIRVVRGIQDLPKLQQGDVLVVPYSDVGWTPLFAKAGAVLAESGGILSHSSIIAREYGIPAVVSIPDVTCLPDDQLVHVDGYTGEVTLQDELHA